jgi:glutamate racemase
LIGVFDSGSGGLTVLRVLERELPEEAFMYFGDHGNAPYGNRSGDSIYSLTLRGLERLFELGCSLVVVACNTAAATGLRQLQQTWLPFAYPSRRVLGIIVPVIEEITGVQWITDTTPRLLPPGGPDHASHVAIFATSHTVRTNVYVTEIGKRASQIRVSQQACPALAQMIDDDATEAAIRTAIRRYAVELLDSSGTIPDICVLGCTHYPLVEHLFAEELPKGVRLLSQAEATATSLKSYLSRHPRFSKKKRPAPTIYLTTGNAAHVSGLASRYCGQALPFQAVGN